MAHESGKNGGVYGNSLVIHACQVAWNDFNGAGCAASTTTGKVGALCSRITTTAVGATTLMAAEDVALDLSTYEAAIWWGRSSVITALGDLHIHISETADCAAVDESLDWPVMAAATWKQCFGLFTGATTTRDVTVSVGLTQVVDLADATFDVDDFRAVSEILGIKSWSLEYTASMLDVTDFANSGVSAFIPGITEWHGSFEGYKEGVPMAIGAEVYLVLGETSVGTQVWLGKAIITNARPNVDHDGLVSYSYDFQGTGSLQAPTT